MSEGERSIGPGQGTRLGAHHDGGGVSFAVFSDHAEKIELCLFDADETETDRIELPEREGGIWHGRVSGLEPGQLYGFRAHGPWRPEEGHRFNPAKLLLDPYARRITREPIWSDALYGHVRGQAGAPRPDARDSAPFMPKAEVVAQGHGLSALVALEPLGRPLSETVIYEAHVKGLTRLRPDVAAPGTYLGLASDAMLEHLTGLGITAIELLPVQSFITDDFLHARGLTNYWGYQPLGFFAPDRRYAIEDEIAEFQVMVARLHEAGIEVILDVVYNHTGEGGALGPTLAFRGLDNASYYRLGPGGRYINDTGTGNTLNLDHPMVLRMVMDSLRLWAAEMGVDGFRFDLATVLGRAGEGGFDAGAAFFDALRQDPVLARVKLIAEPWDVGPGGYQLGHFPHPFAEWNDRFRDGVRRFWRGDAGQAPELARRITGSAELFDHDMRPATSSVNLITAHDGFTLEDVVSYARKHNEANGEDNRDGHNENYSDNLGVEGPTDDPAIRAARDRRKRNMLATLFLSQGTPMLLAGDELGHSQEGNNNAYAQDNRISWIDWARADTALMAFVRRLIAFRKAHPILRQTRFLHSRERARDGRADLFWHRPEGGAMRQGDWADPTLRILIAELRMAHDTPAYAEREEAVLAVFNAGPAWRIVLPPAPEGMAWAVQLDTARPEAGAAAPPGGGQLDVAAGSVVALVLERVPSRPEPAPSSPDSPQTTREDT